MKIKCLAIVAVFTLLAGCSSPESDGKRAGELACKVQEAVLLSFAGEINEDELKDLQEEMDALEEKIEGYTDRDDQIAAQMAMLEAVGDC